MDDYWGTAVFERLQAWVVSIDPSFALLSVVLVFCTILLRAPIARLFTSILAWGLTSAGVTVSDAVRTEANTTLRSIVVLLALVALLNDLNPPKLAGGVLERSLYSLIIVIVFSALVRRANLIMQTLIPQGREHTLDTRWISRVIQFIFAVVGFAVILEVWGITISGALTGVGVLGAGIAIAAQDFVRNLIAGLNNISEGRFVPGDWIQADNGLEGTVESMDLRSTTIMGFDHVPRFVPNSVLSNAVLKNFSRMDMRLVDWNIGLVLEASDHQVQRICHDIEEYGRSSGHFVVAEDVSLFATPIRLTSEAVEVRVYMFAEATEFEKYSKICGALSLAVKRIVSEAGTELAYPTQTNRVQIEDITKHEAEQE